MVVLGGMDGGGGGREREREDWIRWRHGTERELELGVVTHTSNPSP